MSYQYKFVKPLAAGAIFGAALTSAGVYHPAVIIGQMKFEDFTMLKVFLTATAVSASVIPLAIANGFTKVRPRPPHSLGLFSQYDANMIGGTLLGIGMALSGACPGTILPQIATGIDSSLYVGVGGIIGAMLFELLMGNTDDSQIPRPTVHSTLGVHETWPIVAYQLLCMSVVTGAAYVFPTTREYLVGPLIGGILIAGSQAANLVLMGNALGVSGAYASIAHWITTIGQNQQDGRDYRSVIFVSGALLGSLALSLLAAPLPSAPDIQIGAIKALIGGVLLLFGARLGGGCTSGHGITGMSQLSISSFITVAAMFGGGMVWSFLFG